MEEENNQLTAAVFRAALEASCFRGALPVHCSYVVNHDIERWVQDICLPPVDLRAVCLVRAIANIASKCVQALRIGEDGCCLQGSQPERDAFLYVRVCGYNQQARRGLHVT